MENKIHVPNHQPVIVPGSTSDALGMQMAEVFRT
jgi:hypothetical protein